MKHINFVILFICFFSIVGKAQNTEADILLDSDFLSKSSINDKFINSVDYTSDGFILLSSAKQFYILGIGGIVPVFESLSGQNIESFTVTTNGILMFTSGNSLYQASENPDFTKKSDLPDSNMGITSNYSDIFVFDKMQKRDKKDYSIYQISKDRKITKLTTVSAPVLSVFEQPKQLIFSTKNMLLCVDTKTKKTYQILALPQENNIISIVGDTVNHAFYFSTENAIYRIKNNKFELITDELGGILKYDGEGLVIFNSEKQLIIRLRNNIL